MESDQREGTDMNASSMRNPFLYLEESALEQAGLMTFIDLTQENEIGMRYFLMEIYPQQEHFIDFASKGNLCSSLEDLMGIG